MATIADLIMRQGEIAARGAERSGEIWGNAVSQLGQIGGRAFEEYQAKKEENKQATALNDFVQSGVWMDNPQAAVEGSVKVLGPRGVQFAQALIGAAGLKKARSPEEARQAVKMIAQGFPAAPAANKPQFFTQAYTLMQEAGIAPAGEIPQYNPAEHDPYIAQLAGTTGGQGEIIETIGPDGMPVKRRVGEAELVKGVPVYKAPEAPKPPATQNIGGRVMQFNPESGRYDILLGASEAALNREAASAARAVAADEKAVANAEKKAEKEREAAEAKRATDSQVKAAFAAMKEALGEVKKYSGTKSVISPLAATNARQQYDDAAKAFAATLSRATGDNRISDLDRKSYANLLAYSGIGTTAIKVLRPDLVEDRLTKAENMFEAAAEARGGGAPPPKPPPSNSEKSALLKKHGF